MKDVTPPVGAWPRASRLHNLTDFARVFARQAQQALGVRGVASATAAGLVGVFCCLVAFAEIWRSLNTAEVENRQREATEIAALADNFRILMRNVQLQAFGNPRPETYRSSTQESWARFSENLTIICKNDHEPLLRTELLSSICAARPDFLSRVLPELEAFDPPARRLDPEAQRLLLAMGRDVHELGKTVAFQAGTFVQSMTDRYRTTILILTLSTAGFVSAGLVLVFLVGRVAVQAVDARDLLSETIEALPAGVVLYDAGDRLMLFNSVANSLSPGMSAADAIGKTYAEGLDEIAKDREAAGLGPQKVWIGEQLARFASKGARGMRHLPDGRWIELYEKSTPSGHTVGLRLDITALKNHEVELEHSHAEYQSLVDSLSDVVFAVDDRGIFTFASAAATDLLGIPVSQLIGSRFKDHIDPEDRDRVLNAARDLHKSANEAVHQLQFRLQTAGGIRRHVDVRYRKNLGPGGQQIGMSGVIRDIEEQIRMMRARDAAEDQLRQSQERYRHLFEASPYPLYVTDRETLRILAVSDEAVRLQGWSREEFLTMTVDDLYPPEDVPPIAARRKGFTTSETQIIRGLRHRRKDGTVFDIEIATRLIEYDGRLAHLTMIADVTERLRAERARQAAEERNRHLFEVSPYPIYVVDRETLRIVAVSDEAVRMSGWSRDEFLTMIVDDLYAPEDRQAASLRREDFTSEKTQIIQGLRYRRKDGTIFDVEIAVRVIEHNGRLANLAMVRDVTERLRAERARLAAEEQLRQSQKMEAVGQLTGGVAHDLNNILTIILANAEILQEEEALDPGVMDHLDRIAKAVGRASDLTRSLLAFSRKQALRPTPTVLNDLATATGKLLRRTLGEDIELDAILADDLWTVDIDRAQLESAIVNLCINARDAMPGGGRLLIETKNVTLDEEYVAQHPDAVAGEYVLLAVSDTGCGMPPDVVAKVFEPFFTTKEMGKGTGLGLSMVYGFVRQSDGYITVESEVGRGTSFKLFLPRSKETRAVTGIGQKTLMARGAERILVVEDEPDVRTSVVGQLESLGYAVSDAPDGAAGIAALEAATRPFDLLLTDVVMPGPLSGKALADEVARRWPATRIVFMTGYSGDALTRSGRLDAGVLLLSKPFRKADLARIVRQALHARQSV